MKLIDSMQEMMEFYKSENYRSEYHRRENIMGIRRTPKIDGNRKQVISFGAGLGLSKLALERWAGRVLKRLDQGSTEYEANVWIHAKMADFRVGQ